MSDEKNNIMLESNAKEHKKSPKQDPGLQNDNSNNTKKKFTFSIWYFVIAFILIIIANNLFLSHSLNEALNVDYSTFKSLISEGKIVQVAFDGDQYIGYGMTKSDAAATLRSIAAERRIPQSIDTSSITAYQTYMIDDPSFVPLLDSMNVEYYATEPVEPSAISYLISMLFPIAIFFIFYWWMSKRLSGGAQGVMSFSQNSKKLVAEDDTGIRFADVAGEDEAKAELVEVVDFLKNPDRYTEMGAKIPKGVLLVGPPGTGKTLLAKAVAGEAGVPFFRMSGADFVEMFVGVGAARVRDLFKQAREKSPCIIFIDEIDAIGRKRSDASIGGNDEREQTLNQLLTEMDGFESNNGVIILAATNRPESLDPALTRPGRFDRRVPVELPDLKGREEILKVHAKKVKLDESVDFNKIARMASGASGAELANIINEAALRAVRENRSFVTEADLEESIEVVIAGYQKKNAILTDKEKRVVAYHEIGHALVAAKQNNSAPVQKITIVPRTSGALGYTMQVEEGNHYLMSQEELENKIATLTGGRAAEELVFHSSSTGASNDIEQATKLARSMITRYGMSKDFDMVAMETVNNQYLGGDTSLSCSAETQAEIDRQVVELVKKQHEKAAKILADNREKLDQLADYLYDRETITGEEFMNILNAA